MNSNTTATGCKSMSATGRVRLYTMNAAEWTGRYPLIVKEAARIKGDGITDAEVVCAGSDGMTDFEALHSRTSDHHAIACAFDLLRLDGDVAAQTVCRA
jgi:ATP-dependent DNA ligase